MEGGHLAKVGGKKEVESGVSRVSIKFKKRKRFIQKPKKGWWKVS